MTPMLSRGVDPRRRETSSGARSVGHSRSDAYRSIWVHRRADGSVRRSGSVPSSDHSQWHPEGMGRRVIVVAIALLIVGALGPATDGGGHETTSSYTSAQALGRAINAHGIGCSRVYPSRLSIWADHDAASCQVGAASVTLHVWKGVARPTDLGEASRHVPWVVGPNWLVATTNRRAAEQVVWAIGGDLIP